MLLIAMVLFTLSLTSCDTDSMKPNTSGTVTLHVSFTAKEGKTTRALSGNEDKVNDITVLVFNSNKDLIGSGYETFSGNTYSMDVTTHVDNNCTVYAIANTHSSSYFKGINTIDELNAMSVTPTQQSAASLGADSNDIMMSGEQTGVNITTSGSNLNPIAMSHLCSKINFSIVPKSGSGITVTGYQLCEVPLSSYVTDSHTAVTASPNGNYGSFDAVTLSSPTAEATVTPSTPYYVYENLAGNGNASSTSETSRTQSNAPSNGYATYLLVYAKTSSWHSTYRIYLGGVDNDKSSTVDYANYNIYRNMNYTYKIYINGSGQSDARVTYTADGPVPVTPGIYYFSDGTWGTLADNSGKTPIAVVFSNTPGPLAKSYGFKNGLAIALTDAISGTGTWGSYSTPAMNNTYYNYPSDASGDMDSGFRACYVDGVGASLYSGTYNAYYQCHTVYESKVPANPYNATSNPNGNKNSGWYLPSMGEVVAMYQGLGLVSSWSLSSWGQVATVSSDAYSKFQNYFKSAGGTATAPVSGNGDYYWSSSEYSNAYYACMFYYTSSIVYFNAIDKGYNAYMRAFLAF